MQVQGEPAAGSYSIGEYQYLGMVSAHMRARNCAGRCARGHLVSAGRHHDELRP